MREFQEKHKMKRRIYSKTSLFILFCILVLTARGVLGVYAKESASRADLARVNAEKAQLQARAANIETDSSRISTPEGVEAEIRTKFDVAKKDEGVIVIVDRNDAPPVEEDKGILKKFWDSIVGVFHKNSTAPAAAVSAVQGK